MSEQTEQSLIPPELNLGAVSPNQLYQPWAFFEANPVAFALPSTGSLTITVANSARYAAGMYLALADLGIVVVVSLPSATSIQIERVEGIAGTQIPYGTPICPCAKPANAVTATGIYDTIATGFVVPALGASVTITFSVGKWASTNMFVFISGAGWFKVTAEVSDKQVEITNIGSDGVTQPKYNAQAGYYVSANTPCWPSFPPPFKFSTDDFVETPSAGLGTDVLTLKNPFALSCLQNIEGTGKQRFTTGKTATILCSNVVQDSTETVLATIAFPATFATAPVVHLTPEVMDIGTTTQQYWMYWFGQLRVKDVTTLGFKITIVVLSGGYHPGGAPSFKVHWTAIGAIA